MVKLLGSGRMVKRGSVDWRRPDLERPRQQSRLVKPAIARVLWSR
jgi:hypothetical protein